MKMPVFFLLLFFLMTVPSKAVDFQDVYGGLVDTFESFVDSNAGSTSFLSLLIPAGGLSEGMARAYTAVTLDSSFFDYNPSVSSVLENTEAGFLHNNWIADSMIESAVLTHRFGDLGAGVAGKILYVPFSQYNDWGEKTSKGYYSETTVIGNASYNFLSGYYFSGIAAGTNLKLIYRSVPDYADPSGSLITGSGGKQSAIAILGDIGLLTRLNLFKYYSSRTRNFSVGLSAKNLGISLLPEDPVPTVFSAGVSYRPIRPVMASFDASKPVNLVHPEESEALSVGAGVHVTITDSVAMQGGLLFKGGNPRFSIGSTIDIDDISFVVNYTYDLTSKLAVMNRVSVAAKINMGDSGRAKIQKTVEDYYLLGIEEYANGNMETAMEKWKKALELNPLFDPARESLNTALGAMKLQERMDNVQKLE